MKYDAGMKHLHGDVLAAVRLMLTFDTEITKEFSPSDGSPAPLREYLKNRFKHSGQWCDEARYDCDSTGMEISFERPLNNEGEQKLRLSWSQLAVFIRNNWDEVFKKESNFPCDGCCNYPETKDDYQGEEREENGMNKCEFYGGTDFVSQTSTKIKCVKMPEGGRVFDNKDQEGAALIQCCWHGGENCPLLNEEPANDILEDKDVDFDDDPEEDLDDDPRENDEGEEDSDDGVDITKDGPALKALAAAFLDGEIKCPNFHKGGECKPRCLTLDGRVGALDFKCSECTMGFSETSKAMDWLSKCTGCPQGCVYYRKSQKSQEGKTEVQSDPGIDIPADIDEDVDEVVTTGNEIKVCANPEIINERQEKALKLHRQILANGKIVEDCIVAIGRDLSAIKKEKLFAELECKDFDEYCTVKLGLKGRQGYKFVRAYERFGEEKLAQIQWLGITKLDVLARLDSDEDVDNLISSGEADKCSSRELTAKIKELNEQVEQLTLFLDEEREKNKADIPLKTRIEDLQVMLDKANREKMELETRAEELEQSDSKRLTELNDFMAASKDDKERVAARHEEEVRELERKIRELSEKPAEVREMSDEEKEQIRTETENALRREFEEKADNERQAAVDEATKKVSEKYASEIERLKSENEVLHSSAKNNPESAPSGGKEKVKFYLGEIERAFNSAMETISGMDNADQGKCRKAMKTAIERMLNALGG